MALAITFLETGSDATGDLGFYSTATGTVASDTVQSHTGPRSVKFSTGSPAVAAFIMAPTNPLLDTGTQISFWFRFDVLPAADTNIIALNNIINGNVAAVKYRTTGALACSPLGVTTKNGTAVMAVNTWYRITISYYINTTSDFTFKVYLNGALEITMTQSDGTMTRTGADQFRIALGASAGTNRNMWIDDLYIATGGASSSSQPDTGDIRVTAKLPFSNGTTNGFTGSGTPSGYGTGNSGYVNERPKSSTNNVAVVAVGVTTEEYNIEGITVGDASLQAGSIVGYGGWLYAKALLSETATMIVNGTNFANVALTSADAMFTNYVTASGSYLAGTGADIGITTTALGTTVTLEECGVLIAYKPFFNPYYYLEHVGGI